MESTPAGKGNRKNKENKDEEYPVVYIKHLEKRLRNLETEKHLLESEKLRLEQELHSLRNEIDRLREPPLLTGTIIDSLKEKKDRAIIHTSSGPDYVVKIHRKIRHEKFKPGTNVALNQRTFTIMERIPAKLDPFIKGMELSDTIPDVSFSDIGGLEDQIQEVRETVELPLKRPELFKKIGIDPPKGVLLFGPPGTGKTLLAKAVAHETEATFIKIIGSELVQKFIGEGARYVREVFHLARKKAPTILLIDELDAVAAERMEDATSGDREVQRTMMQLLSELDGFSDRGDVKIIGATNRIDILDKALLRPGRFDRIIEFPVPNEEAREAIFKIHTRSLNLDESVKIKVLVSMTDNATGADIKSICTEAGMFAIRRDSDVITHEDFLESIKKVMKKLKESESVDSKLFV